MDLGPNGKANFTWSMIGTVFESALNFVLLIIVNRVIGENGGGVFTLAFSHAQLMYYIGTLEVRPIHSTDVKQKYRFADYFSLRSVTCALMLLASLAYVLLMDGDPFKKRVVMYMCVYKVIDAMLDVFASMFQQHDRIEYSGKVSTLRIALELTGFTAVLIITRNLEWASLTMIAIALTILMTYNLAKWRKFDDVPIHLQFSHAREILTACLPLFVSVFVMLYISNAPKYAINTYCTDVIQNRYSILFMPAFTINLFCQFAMRPMLTPISRMWNDRRLKEFRGTLLKMLRIIGVVTVLGIGGAWLLGIPILNLLYGVDLTGDRSVLIWVMVYGGLNAVNLFLYDIIAVTRNQNWLLLTYGISAAAVFFLAPVLVRAYEMTGAIAASIFSLGLLDVMLAAISVRVIRRAGKTGQKAAEPGQEGAEA